MLNKKINRKYEHNKNSDPTSLAGGFEYIQKRPAVRVFFIILTENYFANFSLAFCTFGSA